MIEISRTEISQTKRKMVFDRDKGKCQICEKELTMELDISDDGIGAWYPKNYYTIDHIKPVSKDGKNNYENLRLLCRTCNCMKHNREADDFIKVIDKNILKSFEFNNKELLLKDYIQLGEKEILINGLNDIKSKVLREIDAHISLINSMEG